MITLTIKSLKGTLIRNATVTYNNTTKEVDTSGKIEIDANDDIEITVKAEGYSDNTFTIKKSEYDIQRMY